MSLGSVSGHMFRWHDVDHSFYRAFEDEKKARMGVVECVKHSLLEPFNVLWEKEGQ